jgi:hypothetical protein
MMAKDYSDIGLAKGLIAQSSLSARKNKVSVNNIDFEGSFQVQNQRLNASKINLDEFAKSAAVSETLGTFTSAASFDITTEISYDTPNVNFNTFALPHVAIYEGSGSASADQIFPTLGANVTIGRYDIQSAFNLDSWDGTVTRWSCILTDTNGTSTGVFNFQVQWVYADYRTGVNSSA